MNWKTLTVAVVLLSSAAFGQTEPAAISLIIKGGESFYGALAVGNLGGGGPSNNWRPGPMLGAGIEYSLTSVVKLQGTIEYSTHGYSDPDGPTVLNSPTNTLLDISVNARFAFGFFYGLAGMTVYRQHIDGSSRLLSAPFTGSGVVTEESTDVAVGANAGLGILINITPQVGLFAESSLRMRRKVTPVIQAGFSFGL